MSTVVNIIRLIVGFLLQVLPYSYMCIIPFSDKFRFRHGIKVTVGFVFLCAAVFSVISTCIFNKTADPNTIYPLTNFVFMIMFCCCFVYYCLAIDAKITQKIYTICYVATFAFFISLIVTVLWHSKLSGFFPERWEAGYVYEISYDIFLFSVTAIIFPLGYILVKKQLAPTVNVLTGKTAIYFAAFSMLILCTCQA